MTTETLAALGPSSAFEELGKGGEGQVFGIPSRPNAVYKQYLQTAATAPGQAALQELIDLRATMTTEEQKWLAERTIWPEIIVVDQGRMRGFLMQKISPEYFRRQGIRSNPRTVLCEWNLLALRDRYLNNPNVVSSIPKIEPFDALRLVLDLAKTVALLHKYRVIIGDMSGRNLLWTDHPTWRVMIIDCDSLRIDGSTGVASPKQSPDWDDPHLNDAATTQSSDIYKLGLAAFRGIWAATTDRPDHSLPLRAPNTIPNELVNLVLASTSANNRPSAEEWVSKLQPSIQFAGRPVVSTHKSVTATPNGIPRSSNNTGLPTVLPSKQRPVIKMKEPPASPTT
jgi:DNA-binding helix-hairpin-helix protein with protein kinase domain